MMSQEQSDILLLSFFYWGLSVMMLRIVIIERRHLLYGLSALYLSISALVGWKIEMTWMLAGSLIFMGLAMVSTLWILLKQSRQCINELKQMREEETTDGQ